MRQLNYGLILSLLLLAGGAANAETQYIHDVLRVDMRSGPTNGYRIINFLRSGTPVEVMGQSDDGEWTQVRAYGKEGWIQSQYLTSERIAKDLLEEAQQRVATLEQRNRELQSQLANSQSELKELKALQQQVESSEQSLRKELENLRLISSNAVETSKNFEQQAAVLKLREVELEKLAQENMQLKDNTMVDGIKWGAISVIAGALLALMIPKMTTRKRRSDW